MPESSVKEHSSSDIEVHEKTIQGFHAVKIRNIGCIRRSSYMCS